MVLILTHSIILNIFKKRGLPFSEGMAAATQRISGVLYSQVGGS